MPCDCDFVVCNFSKSTASPVIKHHLSPYQTFGNSPISKIDPNGDNEGDYYDKNGTHLGSDGIDDNKVYTADNVTKNDQGLVTAAANSKELNMTHTQFQSKAATVYGESSAFKTNGATEELKKEMFAIASVHARNNTAYGATSDQAKLFTSTDIDARNGTKMQVANAAIINAATGGFDYSFGASNWDGIEQANFAASDTRYSNGRFELHKNTIGWSISDEHYGSWKSYATSNGYGFKAPQVSKSVEGTYHRGPRDIHIRGGLTGFKSTAVYGGTIFWKK